MRIAKVLPKASSPKPKKCCINSRCPVDDTGRYSVKPSTTPRTTALMKSSIAIAAPPVGRPPTADYLESWLTPRFLADTRRAGNGKRLIPHSSCRPDATTLRISIRLPPDCVAPPGATAGRVFRKAHADAVSPRLLPALPLRAARARRIRAGAPAGGRAPVGTSPRLPGDEPGRDPAGAGRGRMPA